MISDIIQTISQIIYNGSKSIVLTQDTVYYSINIIQKEGNSSLLDKILENGITILIALIAGLVALYQVKSNIVSSARIKWIEEVRQDISKLYDASLGTILYWGIYVDSKEDKDYDKYDLAHSNFFILGNKICMNLNISETKHKELINLIDEIETILDPNNIDNSKQEDVEIILKK